MKRCQLILGVLLSGAANFTASPQGFINLNFESGTLVHDPADPAGSVKFSAAFPGWTGYVGTNAVTYIRPDFVTAFGGNISLISPTNGPTLVIEGNWTAVLQGGTDRSAPGASIAQTGLVPTDATFLLFKGSFYLPTIFGLSFAGQSVPYSALSTGTNAAGGAYTTYVADLAPFAGQVGELRLTAPGLPSASGFPPPVFLDSLQFSSVPEPGTLALGGLGALFVAAHLWRVRRKRH